MAKARGGTRTHISHLPGQDLFLNLGAVANLRRCNECVGQTCRKHYSLGATSLQGERNTHRALWSQTTEPLILPGAARGNNPSAEPWRTGRQGLRERHSRQEEQPGQK